MRCHLEHTISFTAYPVVTFAIHTDAIDTAQWLSFVVGRNVCPVAILIEDGECIRLVSYEHDSFGLVKVERTYLVSKPYAFGKKFFPYYRVFEYFKLF